MSDTDRDVRFLLERMAEEAGDPPPISQSLQRRTAMRRGQLMVGVAATVLAIGFAGTYMSGAFQDDRSSGGIAIGVTPGSEDPTEGVSEGPPEEMQGDLVAQGESDGVRWWLSAYLEGENLCTEFFTETADGGGSGGGGCGGVDDKRHPIGLGVSSGDGTSSATGHVPLEVERLEMVMRDGTTSTITEFYDAPEGLGLPIKFYVVIPFPDGTDELVAYNAEGQVVGRQDVFDPSDEPKISRIAGPFTIAEGEHKGIPYVFEGYVERQEVSDGPAWTYPCNEFLFGKDERFGGGGGCDIPLARDHHVNYSQQSFDSDPPVTVVHGSVKPSVDRVTVELDSGKTYEAEMFDVEGTDFRFFLIFPENSDQGISGEVVAYRGAEEIERVALCGHDMASVGGSCGP